MRKYLIFWLILTGIIFGSHGHSQPSEILKNQAQRCKTYAIELYKGSEDFVKFSYSDSLKNALNVFLRKPEAWTVLFDSIPGFSRVCSADEQILLYTWMIHRSDGHFEYNGCVMQRPDPKMPPVLTWLEDISDTLSQPENKILTAPQWYGCLVYAIIQPEKKNPASYTMLGFDGNDGISRKKIIDILSVRRNGQISFGGPVFVKYGSKTRRVIFEYSAKSTFRLSYDYQTIYYRKPGKKNKVLEETLDILVFDRLVPLRAGLEGQFQFYVPETNVLDGFRWTKGKWLYVKEIDARNPETESVPVKRPPQMGLTPDSK